MKIVQFQAGLGNQIFQYIYYLYLKEKGYNVYAIYNKYLLNEHYGFELNKILKGDITLKSNLFIKIIYKIAIRICKTSIGKDISTHPKALIYSGYYFNKKYQEELHNSKIELDYRKLSIENKNFINKLSQYTTVSIHIRRGDYLKHNQIYGNVCTDYYYKEAIKYIKENFTNPYFIFFSDDSNLKVEKYETENACVVNWNTGENSYMDLLLMSLCDINIIANSSFSYWAANLNTKNILTIYPQRWWSYITPDIFKDNWIGIHSHPTNCNKKVSIIIPIYNGEKYLQRSINSVLNQTYIDTEIILINDGSTDHSSEICKRIAKQDKRVIFFNRNNSGISATREFGLQQATGDYIIYCDCDDWIEHTMIESMVNILIKTEADLVITDYYVETENKTIYIKQEPENSNPTNITREILQGKLHGATWNKMIKKSVIEKHNIHFPKGINYCEDVLFWIQILQHPIKLAYIPNAYYHYDYYINPLSITRNNNKENIEMRKKYINLLEKLISKEIFKHEIIENKLRIKFCALLSSNYNSHEFKSIYPEVNMYIFKMNTSLLNRVILYIASKFNTNVAFQIYTLKKKLQNK